MRESGETILVAILGLIGLELLNSWTGIIVAGFSVIFIVFRLIDMQRKNKRDQEKRKEEQEKRKEEQEKRKEEQEKHELEIQLLKKQLDN